MSFYGNRRLLAKLGRNLLGSLLLLALLLSLAGAQTAPATRKVRSRVVPIYPELARKLNLVANVKVQVTIAPSGAVTDAKAVGGHPLLIEPSVDAAKRYRFEPAGETTTAVIEFHFAPGGN